MANSNGAASSAQTLDLIMAHDASARTADVPAQPTFSDGDGLVSFTNLKSSFITGSPEFKTGDILCSKVAKFFAGMRIRIFGYLQKNPGAVLPGDVAPVTQWDPSVTNLMQNLITGSGGFGAFMLKQETYSQTRTVVDFSMDMIKMIFDAVALPENLATDAAKFIQGVGNSLRISWDNQSKDYKVCTVSICHEAVQTDASGTNYYYVPKVKHYYLSIKSSQQEFQSPCVKVENLTFNFEIDSYVAALNPAVLDPTTTDYAKFVAFLDKAALQDYENVSNTMDSILQNTASTTTQSNSGATLIAGQEIDHTLYPKVQVAVAAL